MAQHILQLQVNPTYNEGILLIQDTSIYTSLLPVSCQSLQITPPGFTTPTVITPLTQNFQYILNACSLGLVGSTGCSDMCPNIPDGIYGIYYTVAPNTQVYVGYQYMRIVSATNRLNEQLCKLSLPNCLPSQELQYELQNIDIIRNYLISAQTNVNDLNNLQDGMNNYSYAINLMDKMVTKKPYCTNY